jgi:hypothetical protein
MNAENLRTLAHELRADPESYNQLFYSTLGDCGAVACIAGHAARLSLGVTVMPSTWKELDGAEHAEWARDAHEVGRVWLGLTAEEALRLFSGGPDECQARGPGLTNWPEDFVPRYLAALAPHAAESTAVVAADLLDALADGTVSL